MVAAGRARRSCRTSGVVMTMSPNAPIFHSRIFIAFVAGLYGNGWATAPRSGCTGWSARPADLDRAPGRRSPRPLAQFAPPNALHSVRHPRRSLAAVGRPGGGGAAAVALGGFAAPPTASCGAATLRHHGL